MKKTFAFILLTIASSFSFAEAPASSEIKAESLEAARLFAAPTSLSTTAVVSAPTEIATVATVTVAADTAPVTPSTPSVLEKGAMKLGSMFGSLVKAPMALGKAFVQGVSSASQPASSNTIAQAEKSAKPAALPSGPAALFSKFLNRAKGTPAAPVEDKSVDRLASN
ncbi:MAG: hypothetical protein Q7S87_08675 [Agitococcus sp.]|nr:hypothetical protein [Agitococcus sp.]MDO9177644.1 hypothetical protein [Agitococcus sp.]